MNSLVPWRVSLGLRAHDHDFDNCEIIGARFGFVTYIDEQAVTMIEQTGVSVARAARYHGLVEVGGSLNSTDLQKVTIAS